ncbi:hypothetical protein ASF24_17100 [Methylobacterium sp. Leaf86]|uniref:hypothetical protein n=1 Tax=Methylobacterium sp. Leaf86 TaxID=1736242 RepID=UPI0006FEAB92|nr:hypothetical protein [Methylobacterium sp. Leaf86]KQO57581.1 hypothetical protein ASF24_17100 [Methylobacterium sp. Leaf86]
MSVKPTPLRKQDAAGVSDIVGAKTVSWDEADKFFGRLANGIHECNVDYMAAGSNSGPTGRCKVSGSTMTTSAKGVTLLKSDPIFNGHSSLVFDGSIGEGLQFDKKDAVGSFTQILVLSLDPEMYAPTNASFKYISTVYDVGTDGYNWRLSTRNVGGVTRQQFAVGSSSLNTNTVQAVPGANTAHIMMVSHDNVGHTSRIAINDPSVYQNANHTALTVSANDLWSVGGGLNDNNGAVFKGRLANQIIVDEAMHLSPEKWASLVTWAGLLRPRYGITL